MSQFLINNHQDKAGAFTSSKAFIRSMKIVPVSLLIAMFFTGCINYYKISSTENINSINKFQLNDNAKHIVVYFKDNTYALKNASSNGNTLTGSLTPLNDIETKYLYPSSKSKNKYKKADKKTVFNQVSIYAESVNVPDNMQLSLPITSITRIDTNEKNKGATTGSHFLGAGIILGVLILIGGLVGESSLGSW